MLQKAISGFQTSQTFPTSSGLEKPYRSYFFINSSTSFLPSSSSASCSPSFLRSRVRNSPTWVFSSLAISRRIFLRFLSLAMAAICSYRLIASSSAMTPALSISLSVSPFPTYSRLMGIFDNILFDGLFSLHYSDLLLRKDL